MIPERTRHCDRGCPPPREPSASASHRSATAGREGARGSAREPGDLPPTKPKKPSRKGVGSCIPISRLASAALVALAALLSCSAPALASGSSSVIVRVEGETHTLVGPAQVQTPEAPVSASTSPEHTCPGTAPSGRSPSRRGGMERGMVRRLRLLDRIASPQRATRSAAGASGTSGSSTRNPSKGSATSSNRNPAREMLVFPCLNRRHVPEPAGDLGARVGERRRSGDRARGLLRDIRYERLRLPVSR